MVAAQDYVAAKDIIDELSKDIKENVRVPKVVANMTAGIGQSSSDVLKSRIESFLRAIGRTEIPADLSGMLYSARNMVMHCFFDTKRGCSELESVADALAHLVIQHLIQKYSPRA